MEIALGISGASGARYGIRLLELLSGRGVKTHLIITEAAGKIIEIETDYDPGEIRGLASAVYRENDFTAPIASGSHKYDALVVAPCSMKTVAAIANGFSDNLIERAADVCLKEKRKVILLVRETPFSQIHLENMLKLSRAGADILPASPAFYNRPENIDDLINFMAGRVLDLLGIGHDIYRRWK
jgi:4-hydroxy-3-polyprenylbenzoate decarboxylase